MSYKWLAVVLITSLTPISANATPPPACDPNDAACLLDQSLYHAFRANVAEKKLEGCQIDLSAEEQARIQAEQNAETIRMGRWLMFGVGVTLAVILTSYTVAKAL